MSAPMHVLTVSDDGPRLACLAPAACEGWIECRHDHGDPEPHPDHGCEDVMIHGVAHTWQGYWAVPYAGCIVQDTPDAWRESASEMARGLIAGAYLVDPVWIDGATIELVWLGYAIHCADCGNVIEPGQVRAEMERGEVCGYCYLPKHGDYCPCMSCTARDEDPRIGAVDIGYDPDPHERRADREARW